MVSAWWLVYDGIKRDTKEWLWTRHIMRTIPPVEPAELSERYIVAEISTLTGTPSRYWRGTDRDRWTKDRTKACLFPTPDVAIRQCKEFMLDVYRPNHKVLKE